MAIILKRPLSILPAEIGVPFDAADEHDAVAAESIAIHEGFDAVGGLAERNHIQRADNGAPHGGLVNAVLGQDVGLALGGGGAVTSHGREDERLAALRFPILHHRAGDVRDVGDAAAADTDSDARSGLDARSKLRTCELPFNFARDVRDRAVREFLAYR